MSRRPPVSLHPLLLSGVLLFGLLLAGCGPLPQPFKPGGKDAVTLAAYENAVPVLVLPLQGTPPGDPAAAAARLAEALRALGIPAGSGATAADQVLSGSAEVIGTQARGDLVRISWRLDTPDGQALGKFEQAALLPTGLWDAGQPTAVESVMVRAAQQALALFQSQEAATGATSRATLGSEPLSRVSRPRLVLLPMNELPGDGSYSLPRALERALSEADYEIGWDIGEDDLLIMGDIAIEPEDADWDEITVTWWVVRAETGEDLGQVDQANRLPSGVLNGKWGNVAEGIAGGAAEGIDAVIRSKWRP